MCWAQRHVKRLLAFSTIGHVGIMTLGVATLSTRGLAGACVYALGHGLVKASLFVLAGVLLHARRSVDEIRLRGRGPAVAAVPWLVAGLALAGLPPFGTFVGAEAVEKAASEGGRRWVAAVTSFVEVITAAAVLRVGGRVFLGWGPRRPEVRAMAGDTEDEKRETRGPRRVPWSMPAAAIALVALGLAVGVVPGVQERALAAAARVRDPGAYADAVLGAAPGAAATASPVPAPTSLVEALPRAFIVTLGAAALAVLTLVRQRLPRRPRELARRAVNALYGALRPLHTGHVGDYVTWLVLGVAAVTLIGELTMRAR
jgi:multicomponent Na+:H+ antiporter subunit D